MKLIFEVEIQAYGEDKTQQREILQQISNTLVSVVSLCDISVGTFTSSLIDGGEVRK